MIKYEELTDAQQKELHKTLSHWLSITNNSFAISGKIVNRLFGLNYSAAEYRKISEQSVVCEEDAIAHEFVMTDVNDAVIIYHALSNGFYYLWDNSKCIYHSLINKRPQCRIKDIPESQIRLFESTVDLGLCFGAAAVRNNKCPHCFEKA